MKRILLLITALTLFFTTAAAHPFSDSLQMRLAEANDTIRIQMLCDLCWEYRFVDGDSALLFGGQALGLAQQIGYAKGEAQAYNDMGIVYIGLGKFDKALDFFSRAMTIRRQLNDSSGMASLYNKMGIVFQKKGDLKQALENQLKALKIYEELGQDLWIGYCLNNVAIVHQNLGNLQQSLDYHFQALEYRKKMKDRYGEGGSYGNIANVYVKMGDTATALKYYDLSLAILREVGDDEAVSVQLSNMGNIYMALGDNDKAMKMLLESLKIRERQGDRKGIASASIKLGELYLNRGQYDKAGSLLYRGLRIARQIQVVEEEMAAYLTLGKMYALKGNLDSAFHFSNHYITTKDSVYEARLQQQIVDVQEKYETEKRKQEIAMLKQQKELDGIKLKQRKTENILLIVLLFLVLVSGVFYFYRRRQKQQAILDAAAVQHAEKQLQAVLEGQEQERRRIASELHDGVGQTLSAVKLNWEVFSDSFKDSPKFGDLQKMAQMMDQAVKEVRTISHQMMPKELEQFGLVPSIRGVLQFSLGQSEVEYEFEATGMEERLDRKIELGLFRIVQELIANIVKHSGATRVQVRLVRTGSQVMLLVEDNGRGFDYEAMEGKGIGLMNIQGRVKGLGGVLNVETAKGKGTLVTIRIPLQ